MTHTSTAQPSDADLTAQLGELAAMLSASHRAPDPDRMVTITARAVPHADFASLTVITARSRPRTLASTADLLARLDELQYELDEGPCLEAIDTDDYVHTDDLSRESRWPRFGPRAVADCGVHSMLSIRLTLTGELRAALNFYALDRAVFTEHDVAVSALLSGYVGMAVALAVERERSANLEVALGSSRQIGMAMGILMSSRLLTADQAFEELRAASQHLHRKIRDIAGEVMDTGALPETRDRP